MPVDDLAPYVANKVFSVNFVNTMLVDDLAPYVANKVFSVNFVNTMLVDDLAPYVAKKVFSVNFVNTMPVDDLAPYVARPSTAMILEMSDEQTLLYFNKSWSASVLWIRGCPVANGDPSNYSIGQSFMTPEVTRWAPQLLINGNMIKQKTCKFCVDN